MPIAINGSGTITGIAVGGMPDGVVDTDVIAANAVTTAKLGTNEASGLCKAWVNFNGTGTVAIRDSYNVSSITDNGTGDYTVNFTTALEDANYSAVFGATIDGATIGGAACIKTAPTTTSLTILGIALGSSSNTNSDKSVVSVAIFR